MKRINNYSLLTLLLCVASLNVHAQKDTLKKTTIDITSVYKPVLLPAVKINLAATPVKADTSHPKLVYTLPTENLFFGYQPIPIEPVTVTPDSNLNMGSRNFIKAGLGNFSTALLSGGFSFGDGKKWLTNLYTDYRHSKGKIQYQKYSNLNIRASGSYFLPKNEAYGSVTIGATDYYLYGYDHAIYKYTKSDSLHYQLQDITLKGGIRNTVVGDYGISYNPSMEINSFSNNNWLTENSLILNAPVTKEFGEALSLKVEAKADMTLYHSWWRSPVNIKYHNNVFQLAPSLSYSSTQFTIHAGITPTWNNGDFVWLPNVYGEAKIPGKIFVLQAGWVGRYTKNTYRNLVAINPYIDPFSKVPNTREIEYYGGIKAKLGKHFAINAKAGLVSFNNLPFFINDTATDNKSFKLSNESKLKDIRVHGDISYISQDKFSLNAGITFNGYTGMQNNAKAWNTVPMEITGSLRWWAYKQVLLKADFYAFAGGNYLEKGNIAGNFKPGTDFSAGTEFKFNKRFSAWLDVNNIFNNKYERWHNYPVYGLNLVAGVKMNF